MAIVDRPPRQIRRHKAAPHRVQAPPKLQATRGRGMWVTVDDYTDVGMQYEAETDVDASDSSSLLHLQLRRKPTRRVSRSRPQPATTRRRSPKPPKTTVRDRARDRGEVPVLSANNTNREAAYDEDESSGSEYHPARLDQPQKTPRRRRPFSMPHPAFAEKEFDTVKDTQRLRDKLDLWARQVLLCNKCGIIDTEVIHEVIVGVYGNVSPESLLHEKASKNLEKWFENWRRETREASRSFLEDPRVVTLEGIPDFQDYRTELADLLNERDVMWIFSWAYRAMNEFSNTAKKALLFMSSVMITEARFARLAGVHGQGPTTRDFQEHDPSHAKKVLLGFQGLKSLPSLAEKDAPLRPIAKPLSQHPGPQGINMNGDEKYRYPDGVVELEDTDSGNSDGDENWGFDTEAY